MRAAEHEIVLKISSDMQPVLDTLDIMIEELVALRSRLATRLAELVAARDDS